MCVRYSPDGRQLAAGYADGYIKVSYLQLRLSQIVRRSPGVFHSAVGLPCVHLRLCIMRSKLFRVLKTVT